MATDADGFQVVKRKGRHVRHSKVHKATALIDQPASSLRAEDIFTKLEDYKQSLKTTQFYHEVYDILSKVDMSFSVVVCYGIGHVGSCPIAQQQFALLLHIMEELRPSQTWLYDPVLTDEERKAIELSGCALFSKNEMCKYTAKQQTLFYMPHCGKAMYNNLLWANWDPVMLSQIAIVGNSFSSYNERLTKHEFMETRYVYRIFDHCVEYPLPNSYLDTTVFNDLALHTFPLENTTDLPKDTWTDHSEPKVDPLDSEIISTPS